MKPLFEAALTDVEAEDYKYVLAHGNPPPSEDESGAEEEE
jgi:hypothetical protein